MNVGSKSALQQSTSIEESIVPDWRVDDLQGPVEDSAAGRRRVREVEPPVRDGAVRLEHRVRRAHRARDNLKQL